MGNKHIKGFFDDAGLGHTPRDMVPGNRVNGPIFRKHEQVGTDGRVHPHGPWRDIGDVGPQGPDDLKL